MPDCPFRRLGPFAEEDGIGLFQIVLRGIAESEQRIGVRQQQGRVRMILGIADDFPEVHGRMCCVQHLLILFGGARQRFRQVPSSIVGLTREAPLPDCCLFRGGWFTHESMPCRYWVCTKRGAPGPRLSKSSLWARSAR